MALTLHMVTINTTDARALARWWAEQTGGTLGDDDHDGWFVVVELPGGQVMAFQKVEGAEPGGAARVHLDLTADDRAGEVTRLEQAGATKVGEHEMGGFGWTTMADPDGNVFDVAGAAAG